jgi:hypothetical protein
LKSDPGELGLSADRRRKLGDSHLKKRTSSWQPATKSLSAEHMALYEEAMKRFLDELAALTLPPKKRLAA